MSTTIDEVAKSTKDKQAEKPPTLDSFEIRGYRCFGHLAIERLGRVNLIVGKNNVGKTAFLEALWIYLNPGLGFQKILESRFEDKIPQGTTGRHETLAKVLVNRNLPIHYFKLGKIKDEEPISVSFKPNAELILSGSHVFDTSNFFVAANGLNIADVSSLWDRIELTPREEDINEAMKLISPDLIRVRLRNVLDSPRIPYAQVKDVDQPLTLKSFGEGLNRLFGLALALVNCKDGVLLIDEVEGGFHYSILPDVWKLIFNTAKTLNVQVFATTHSKDFIEAFAQAAVDSPEDGMLIRLEKQGEQIVAKTISEERLADAVNYDVEVR